MIDRRPLASAELTDPATAACELLELLDTHYTAPNVDYEYAESTNCFLILYRDAWHTINFSDTTLVVRRPEELLEEIVRVVNLRAMDG